MQRKKTRYENREVWYGANSVWQPWGMQSGISNNRRFAATASEMKIAKGFGEDAERERQKEGFAVDFQGALARTKVIQEQYSSSGRRRSRISCTYHGVSCILIDVHAPEALPLRDPTFPFFSCVTYKQQYMRSPRQDRAPRFAGYSRSAHHIG